MPDTQHPVRCLLLQSSLPSQLLQVDRDRDGLVPGGGAATVIIESYESAVRRGAPIIAEVLSYGFSSNGDHISVPNVDGPARSLEMALRLAGIDKKDINDSRARSFLRN